ncbi:DHHW family protein [Clostridium sp. C8-1-8]|uniref:DHHW family protein n=1 Tax=Clostridium sp. C8-1-8 TaxID=2698831 RepID=UPI00136CA411|nr:DHHW family protein [Clostridium sp. C8-1-8]
MKKAWNKIIIIEFFLYIVLIILLKVITPVKVFSDQENRELQVMPSFSLETLKSGSYTKDFENFIADQFPKRDFWISIKSEVEEAMGKKENNGVYKGKDGYLIQKFKGSTDEDTKEKLLAINNLFNNAKNTNKYFMLVPNSIEILKDKLPFSAPMEDQEKYIRKVEEQLNKDVKVIDVNETMKRKKSEYIYYKTDHHWTTDGAYYAYEKFVNALGLKVFNKNDFDIKTVTNSFFGTSYSKGGYKDVLPDSIKLYIPKDVTNYTVEDSDSKNKRSSLYQFDNLNKKDKYSIFFGGNHPLVKISTEAKTNRKIMIIKDSYANSFVPFLIPHYSEIYMVDPRYFDSSVMELIENNKINDVLFLYNAISFSEDVSITNLS